MRQRKKKNPKFFFFHEDIPVHSMFSHHRVPRTAHHSVRCREVRKELSLPENQDDESNALQEQKALVDSPFAQLTLAG